MLAIVFMLYISSEMCLKLLREYFILLKSTLRKLLPKSITIYPLTDEHWHRSEISVRLGKFILLCKTIPKSHWLAMTKFNLWIALPICPPMSVQLELGCTSLQARCIFEWTAHVQTLAGKGGKGGLRNHSMTFPVLTWKQHKSLPLEFHLLKQVTRPSLNSVGQEGIIPQGRAENIWRTILLLPHLMITSIYWATTICQALLYMLLDTYISWSANHYTTVVSVSFLK